MKLKIETPTLNGSLSVLKAIPGTYLSQTGNPLHINNYFILEYYFILFYFCTILHLLINYIIKIITHNSIQHKRRDQYASEHKDQLVVLA